MSTFLELCRDTAEQSGGVGQAPSTVVGQTGRQLYIVNWVKRAWELIQLERTDWLFLKGTYSGQLVIGSPTYTGASFNADRFARFDRDRPRYRPHTIYDPAIGVADESEVTEISWESWRDAYGRGAQTNQRPTNYAIDPQGAIRYGCAPDKSYMVRGEYWKAPQLLALDNDVPDMPSQHHQRIVARAIMLMHQHDEAGFAFQMAAERNAEYRRAMVNELTPQIDVRADGPLA